MRFYWFNDVKGCWILLELCVMEGKKQTWYRLLHVEKQHLNVNMDGNCTAFINKIQWASNRWWLNLCWGKMFISVFFITTQSWGGCCEGKKTSIDPRCTVTCLLWSYLSALIKLTEDLRVIVQAVSWTLKQQSHSIVQDFLCIEQQTMSFMNIF